jgi:hypothetical protein
MSGAHVYLRLSWLIPTSLELPFRNKLLPAVYSILSSQHELFHLPKSLQVFSEANNLQGGEVLRIFSALAVPAGPGERFGDWPLYGRASHDFHGAPYYSDVALQMEDAGMEEITMYAQLRLIFQASFVDLESDLSASKNLAFVHMYKIVRGSRLNELVRCRELVWDPCIHSSYMVVDVATILRVVHIVPNFVEDGHFFLNKYKF